jgi:hypothetical protein
MDKIERYRDASMAGSKPVPTTGHIVRDVIAELAPDELPIVDGLCQLNPGTVRRRLRRRRRERDPVGFGLAHIAALMTPVAWIVVDEALRRVTDETADSFGSRIMRAVRAAIRWLMRKPAPTVAAVAQPPLTSGQLATVRRRIIELAPRGGLTAEETEILADRVVARLVLLAETTALEAGPATAASLPDSAGQDASDKGAPNQGNADRASRHDRHGG